MKISDTLSETHLARKGGIVPSERNLLSKSHFSAFDAIVILKEEENCTTGRVWSQHNH